MLSAFSFGAPRREPSSWLFSVRGLPRLPLHELHPFLGEVGVLAAPCDWLLTGTLGLLSSSLLTLRDDYFSFLLSLFHHLQTIADDLRGE